MGDYKRYIGVRLYLPASETPAKEGSETGIDVKPHEMGVGVNSISINARRQYYKDSRLVVLRGVGSSYIFILSKLAGLSITAATIAAVGGGWKGYVCSAIIFVIGSAFVLKDIALRWLKTYWR